MIERVYRALWSRIGGQPWTHIIRDSQRKHPLLWLLIAQVIGIILGHVFW